MNAVSLNNLWNYLQGLSLTASNQQWLGERLIEASKADEERNSPTARSYGKRHSDKSFQSASCKRVER